MKHFLFLILSTISCLATFSQRNEQHFYYDTVYIERQFGNAELILKNGTRDTQGFLYNTGGGRTIFKPGIIKLDDTTFLIGNDTLHVPTIPLWQATWPVRVDSLGNLFLSPTWIDSALAMGGGTGWNLTGNAGTSTSTNFIGTTDGQHFLIKTDNTTMGQFSTPTLGNISFGSGAGGSSQTIGGHNVAIGTNALSSRFQAANIVAIGHNAAQNTNNTGFNNFGDGTVAIGSNALQGNTVGGSSVAIGAGALTSLTGSSTSFNIAVGPDALNTQTTGQQNVGLGYGVQPYSTSGSNQLVIQNIIYGVNNSGTGTTVSTGNVGIGVPNPTSKLHVDGTVTATAFVGDGSGLTGISGGGGSGDSITHLIDSNAAQNVRIGANTVNIAANTSSIALKANIASPTFTGTVTIPTPFILGSTSVTTTGTQLNYLNAATGTTGTPSSNLVYSTLPTIAGANFTGPVTSTSNFNFNSGAVIINPSPSIDGTISEAITFTGALGSKHAVEITNQYNMSGYAAAANFDGNSHFGGNNAFNHGIDFQARSTVDAGSSRGIGYGFADLNVINGTDSNHYGMYTNGCAGSGSIINNTGIYLGNITASNTALSINSTTARAQFAGTPPASANVGLMSIGTGTFTGQTNEPAANASGQVLMLTAPAGSSVNIITATQGSKNKMQLTAGGVLVLGCAISQATSKFNVYDSTSGAASSIRLGNFNVSLANGLDVGIAPTTSAYQLMGMAAGTLNIGTSNTPRLIFGGSSTATFATNVVLAAGTTTLVPFKFVSGTNATTALTGGMEFNGTNLLFTRTGTTRESVMTANAVNTVSPTSPNRTVTVVIDGTSYYIAAKTTND